jgi:CTP synthase
VEDTKAIIELLREALLATFPELEVRDCGFQKAPDELKWFRPDVLILDLAEGINEVNAAAPSWDFVWKHHFCPVIIHSAYDASTYEPRNHPFSRYERKTSESIAKVVNLLKEFVDHIDGIRALRNEIETRIANSLREVSPLVWQEHAQPAERREMLLRITRRRVAASLDSSTNSTDQVKAIEQFIYPPLEKNILAGDVLVKRNSNLNLPESYRVVLTPSCDLVPEEGRSPIEDVLLAQCVAVTDKEIIRRFGLQADHADLVGQLGRRLKGDYRSDEIVFPSLHGLWPAMVVDLKRLELLKLQKVALDKDDRLDQTDFFRVASMDSPFRERVTWRYVETTGRPGLPVLDKDALEKDIVRAATPNPPLPQN